MSKPRVVIVVPCFNETESLGELIRTISPIRTGLEASYEIDVMLVNDGSSDNTQQIIEQLSKKNRYIYYRELAHNSGHQSALRAGLDAVSAYDAAIMMDGDLQHPPECLPDMLKTWREGDYNIVQMLRDDSSKDVGLVKYWTSRLYYWLINSLSGLNIEYGSSDFRLVDQAVLRLVAGSPERQLFLRGYFTWLPVRRTTITYKPNKRFAGSSKYTFKKMLKLASDGVLQFSEKPLKLAISLGVVVALSSFIYGLYSIINFMVGGEMVSGWTSLMVVTSFGFGVNFIILGVIGKYLAHAISIQKNRPEYVIQTEKSSADAKK